MKIIIDTDVSLVKGCPLNEAILLAALYYNSFTEANLFKAVLDGYLTFNSDKSTFDCTKFELTQEGSETLEAILLNSEIPAKVGETDRFVNLASKLREIYPMGKKPGTPYQWRDSIATITLRLKALVKRYGDCFTDEQAIDATRRYVTSFNGDYRYMQLLKYFIIKNDMGDRSNDTSQLLSYIENSEGEQQQQAENAFLV